MRRGRVVREVDRRVFEDWVGEGMERRGDREENGCFEVLR